MYLLYHVLNPLYFLCPFGLIDFLLLWIIYSHSRFELTHRLEVALEPRLVLYAVAEEIEDVKNALFEATSLSPDDVTIVEG